LNKSNLEDGDINLLGNVFDAYVFFPLQAEMSLRPVYMGFMVAEMAVVQYKLLQFFITVEQWPAVR